jgi:hypothetical protein
VAELIAGQLEIRDRCAALPAIDPRSPDEIIGYNQTALGEPPGHRQ